MSGQSDVECHFAASAIAAVINFPLWKASSIAQSGFKIDAPNNLVRYYKAVVNPPFRGMSATIVGMTWARGAIFFGSDYLRVKLKALGVNEALSIALPPLVIGTLVQIVNMPLVRATITIQDPSCTLPSTTAALIHIYKTKGLGGLWHGVSAGVLKTVPKYITAVAVKDFMEENLPPADPTDKNSKLLRSAVKSVTAGMAGAILTNPLDVIRNE